MNMEDVGLSIFILVITFLVCFAFGKIGEKRRIGFGWAFVAVFFLNIIGMIIVLCSKKNDVDFVDVKKKGGTR